MVEGTGLENQRGQPPQVRILSFPPNLYIMKKIIGAIISLIIILAVTIAAISFSRTDEKKISIVATNFPAYDFARAVVGEAAEIKMLVKPGAEVHDFEPTPQDIIDIQKSELFICTGGESDEWVEDVLASAEADGVRTLKMMDKVETVEEETVEGMEDEEKEESGEVEYDEHVWASVRNAEKIVGRIKDELAGIFPEKKADFEKNAAEYIGELEKIDQEFREVVENGDRKIIVFGDRFPLRYFADDYGLEYFAAFPGCSEQTEASSKTIAFLIEKIKSEKIPAIFKIEMSSGKIAETIANETGAKILTFNSAHNISAEDFASGITYAEIMSQNVKVLEEALR